MISETIDCSRRFDCVRRGVRPGSGPEAKRRRRHSAPAASGKGSEPQIWTLMIASLSQSTSKSSMWMSS